MKKFYVAKAIREPDTIVKRGEIIGYSVLYETSRQIAPRGDYTVLLGDESYEFRKAEQIANPETGLLEWRVTEDIDAKNASDAAKQTRTTRRAELRDKIATLQAEFQAATTVDELKAVIGPVLRKILQDLYG